MRYRKGTVELNQSQDLPLLRQILRSQFVSHDQLFQFMRLGGHELNRQCFNWRVRRLAEHGFVNRHDAPGLAAGAVYSIGSNGLLRLQGDGEYHSGSIDGTLRRSNGVAVAHALGLNQLHLRLLGAGVVVDWKPEVEIRSQNELTQFGYAKDYDAIVTLRSNRGQARFALEYERSPKTYKEYARIRAAIETERAVDAFLYLVTNYHLLSFVAQCFWQTTGRVFIGLVERLMAAPPGDLELLEAATRRRVRMGDLV
jgi:hypothetical protein